MNKKVLTIIAAMISAILITGCGDKEAKTDSETDTIVEVSNEDDNETSEATVSEDEAVVPEDSLVLDNSANDTNSEIVESEEKVVPVEEAPPMENVNTIGEHYNSTKGSPEYKEEEDLNSDGIIDIYDIVLKEKKEK